ncbi:MAG: hypothetical protein KKG47_05840 [Proteobacteria bacterium]|nr:hypothetical protein [Pseudomonadota bacterium]MBU1736994.1 hypothetical protein [Pseudomonadota bacterium]
MNILKKSSLQTRIFVVLIIIVVAQIGGLIIGQQTIREVQIGGPNYQGIELKTDYIGNMARMRANINLINSTLFSALWENDEGKVETLSQMSERMEVLFVELDQMHLASEGSVGCGYCHDQAHVGEIKESLAGTRKIWEEMRGLLSERIVPALAEEDVEAAGEIVEEKYLGLYSRLMATSKEEIELVREALPQFKESAMTKTDRMILFYNVGGIGAVLFLVCVTFYLTRKIIRTVNHIVENLNQSADRINLESTSSSDSSQDLADMSTSIAASLEETSASLEQINSMIQQNDEGAQAASGEVRNNSQVSIQANADMDMMQTSMGKIKGDSDEIASITHDIQSIAFQTNLLALNAAVEAARAGEAGAGFAVVADEVRSLARRTAEAARNISGLVERAIANVGEGSDRLATVAERLREVGVSSEKVKVLVDEISRSSHEQALGIKQIAKAAQEMDNSTQQLAATSDQNANSSRSLMEQVVILRENIGELTSFIEGDGE